MIILHDYILHFQTNIFQLRMDNILAITQQAIDHWEQLMDFVADFC